MECKSLYRVAVYNCIAAVSLAYHSWWGEGEVGSVAQMARDQKNLILKKTKQDNISLTNIWLTVKVEQHKNNP